MAHRRLDEQQRVGQLERVLACEDQWTRTATTVEVNPPPGRNATAAPLFDTGANACRTTP